MRQIIKYLPLITGIFLFIGYLNYYSFYYHFGINISPFLTPGELAFSFLTLTIPIILTFIYFYVIASSLDRSKDIETKNKNSISYWSPFKEFWKMVKGKIPKDERSLGNIFQIIIDFLSRCVQLTFFIGMTIFILISYICIY